MDSLIRSYNSVNGRLKANSINFNKYLLAEFCCSLHRIFKENYVWNSNENMKLESFNAVFFYKVVSIP